MRGADRDDEAATGRQQPLQRRRNGGGCRANMYRVEQIFWGGGKLLCTSQHPSELNISDILQYFSSEDMWHGAGFTSEGAFMLAGLQCAVWVKFWQDTKVRKLLVSM